KRRTGDLFAIPLCAGIAIGRVGCFLAGLQDDTYGARTTLPWGVDLGDGVARHPVQIYEVVWLSLVASWLWCLSLRPHREGDVFKTFMVSYFAFRLIVEFIKPGTPIGGLTAIQWACAAMLIYYAPDLTHLIRVSKAEKNDCPCAPLSLLRYCNLYLLDLLPQGRGQDRLRGRQCLPAQTLSRARLRTRARRRRCRLLPPFARSVH